MPGPITLSWRHISLVIGGYEFSGFAGDDQPVVFPTIEMVDPQFGKDGVLYGVDTGMLGGEVSVKLQMASGGVKQCLQWLAQRHKGVRRSFDGNFGDTELGFSVQMKGGLLKSCMSAGTPGGTFEATWVFQEIIPDYDGAQFNSDPINANGAPAVNANGLTSQQRGAFSDLGGLTDVGQTAARDVLDEIFGSDGFGDS